jgi:transposase InsO family protein
MIRSEVCYLLPVEFERIQAETLADSILQQVVLFVQRGFPKKPDDKIAPFASHKSQLSIFRNCLMFGDRVVVPVSLQPQVLAILHESHSGIVRMKSLARRYVWWPKMTEHIEQLARQCDACMSSSSNPPQCTVPWPEAKQPMDRVHVDFAGPFRGFMWIIIVDSYTKFPEVYPLTSTTTDKTITILNSVFARFGFPRELVSDNGPQFTSSDFKEFCKSRSIQHILTPPYHPMSNGLAERFVRTFKEALQEIKKGGSIQDDVAAFLLNYRSTPHPSTLKAPAELMFNRSIRSKLALVQPPPRSSEVFKNSAFSKLRCEPKRLGPNV